MLLSLLANKQYFSWGLSIFRSCCSFFRLRNDVKNVFQWLIFFSVPMSNFLRSILHLPIVEAEPELFPLPPSRQQIFILGNGSRLWRSLQFSHLTNTEVCDDISVKCAARSNTFLYSTRKAQASLASQLNRKEHIIQLNRTNSAKCSPSETNITK